MSRIAVDPHLLVLAGALLEVFLVLARAVLMVLARVHLLVLARVDLMVLA